MSGKSPVDAECNASVQEVEKDGQNGIEQFVVKNKEQDDLNGEQDKDSAPSMDSGGINRKTELQQEPSPLNSDQGPSQNHNISSKSKPSQNLSETVGNAASLAENDGYSDEVESPLGNKSTESKPTNKFGSSTSKELSSSLEEVSEVGTEEQTSMMDVVKDNVNMCNTHEEQVDVHDVELVSKTGKKGAGRKPRTKPAILRKGNVGKKGQNVKDGKVTTVGRKRKSDEFLDKSKAKKLPKLKDNASKEPNTVDLEAPEGGIGVLNGTQLEADDLIDQGTKLTDDNSTVGTNFRDRPKNSESIKQNSEKSVSKVSQGSDDHNKSTCTSNEIVRNINAGEDDDIEIIDIDSDDGEDASLTGDLKIVDVTNTVELEGINFEDVTTNYQRDSGSRGDFDRNQAITVGNLSSIQPPYSSIVNMGSMTDYNDWYYPSSNVPQSSPHSNVSSRISQQQDLFVPDLGNHYYGNEHVYNSIGSVSRPRKSVSSGVVPSSTGKRPSKRKAKKFSGYNNVEFRDEVNDGVNDGVRELPEVESLRARIRELEKGKEELRFCQQVQDYYLSLSDAQKSAVVGMFSLLTSELVRFDALKKSTPSETQPAQGQPPVVQVPPQVLQGPPQVSQGPPQVVQRPPQNLEEPPKSGQGPPQSGQGPPQSGQGPPPHHKQVPQLLQQEPLPSQTQQEQPIEIGAGEVPPEAEPIVPNEVELVPGFKIMIKKSKLDACLKKCNNSATHLGRLLLSVFFSDEVLSTSCCKGTHSTMDRKLLDDEVINAIVTFVTERFPDITDTQLTSALNRKCAESRKKLQKTSEIVSPAKSKKK